MKRIVLTLVAIALLSPPLLAQGSAKADGQRARRPAAPRVGVLPPVPPVPIWRAPVQRPSGSSYDWRSGSLYTWTTRPDGTTSVLGTNSRTGSLWQSTIRPDGSASGFDKNSNYWTYDGRTGTYMNLGTGRICVGQGLARVCSGGR